MDSFLNYKIILLIFLYPLLYFNHSNHFSLSWDYIINLTYAINPRSFSIYSSFKSISGYEFLPYDVMKFVYICKGFDGDLDPDLEGLFYLLLDLSDFLDLPS